MSEGKGSPRTAVISHQEDGYWLNLNLWDSRAATISLGLHHGPIVQSVLSVCSAPGIAFDFIPGEESAVVKISRLTAELAAEKAAREKAEAALMAIKMTDGKAREIVKELIGMNPDAGDRMWFEANQRLMAGKQPLLDELERLREEVAALREGR